MFVSPSGNGLKAIIQTAATLDQHKDYFLFIESIKKVKEEEIELSRKLFLDVIAQYKRKSAGKGDDVPGVIIFKSTYTWKDVKTLSMTEFLKHMNRSQHAVLIAITPLFESFLLSNFYLEFSLTETANERKSYSSIPID